MTNQLATMQTMDYATLAALTGQTSGAAQGFPSLKVNNDPGDNDDFPLPLGAFQLTYGDETVYAKKAFFRPFQVAYQYNHYDPDAKGGQGAYVNRSIIVNSLFGEMPDEKGGNKCGKLSKDALKVASEAVQKVQKQIKCRRYLYGLFSAPDAVNAEGKKVVVKPTPLRWSTGGTNFMPIGETLDSATKAKKLMIHHNMEIETKRERNGGTIYYALITKFNFAEQLPFGDEEFELFGQFAQEIKDENKRIMEKHNAALRGGLSAQDIEDAGIVDSLDADFHEVD